MSGSDCFTMKPNAVGAAALNAILAAQACGPVMKVVSTAGKKTTVLLNAVATEAAASAAARAALVCETPKMAVIQENGGRLKILTADATKTIMEEAAVNAVSCQYAYVPEKAVAKQSFPGNANTRNTSVGRVLNTLQQRGGCRTCR